ncbi:MAG: DNA repair protein RecO [Spirochaetota bacterium]|nr:DNA repair protein RecO [Spirochaetota bacterium]
MKTEKIKGFVLKGHPFGESHKMISLFSRELGKLKVIAHGVRKTTSRYGSAFELLNEVSLVISPTREAELYNIKEHSIVSSCHPIRESYSGIQLLYYLSEFLSLFVHENMANDGLYNILSQTLKAMSTNKKSGYELVKSFELKSLQELGFLSELEHCSQCGTSIDERLKNAGTSLSVTSRGGWIVCDMCRNPQIDQDISQGTYRYFLKLLREQMDKVCRVRINGNMRVETDLAFERLMISIVGRKLKASRWQSAV